MHEVAPNRLQELFRRRRPVLGLYVMAGLPEPEAALPLWHALVEAGADFLEIGAPFSDPLADGPTIQRASQRALAYGIDLSWILECVHAFRRRDPHTPLVLMGYLNPILAYGVEAFAHAARASGLDGLIIPDLPLEERPWVGEAFDRAGLNLVLLAAPTSSADRLRQIDGLSRGFVYAVSITGVTGARTGVAEQARAFLERARQLVRRNPLLVGFGIATPEDAGAMLEYADGIIVGSALVERLERAYPSPDWLEQLIAWVRALKAGMSVHAA
ncbi:MAG: tryptophan synthase subunit alpha [Bacteroidetes bacterium]|nr:tryptophan synthase subunit alpha [Rhodothermia bacterium]MCS7155039.1 tryptophan synthase subunit alpha [Bacteroidota bacterium]MCX7907323.1 tryptophan synthase subunit alpha [Bacteroidota bacterium]MDW8137950.1 tryptophan synthase subunit alpha [Bacteroidota bacterium]MDW8286198.1 tryptophan synthase subunit alpha [Bacteroidota bacterium]